MQIAIETYRKHMIYMIKWPTALAIQPRTGLYPRCELIALAGYQGEVNMILSFVIYLHGITCCANWWLIHSDATIWSNTIKNWATKMYISVCHWSNLVTGKKTCAYHITWSEHYIETPKTNPNYSMKQPHKQYVLSLWTRQIFFITIRLVVIYFLWIMARIIWHDGFKYPNQLHKAPSADKRKYLSIHIQFDNKPTT